MSFAFETVLPIFLLIAVGWTLAATGLLAHTVGEGLAAFAATVGIPLLLFETVVYADLGATSPWMVWLCYFPAAGCAWALGQTLARRVFGQDRRTAVLAGMGATFANIAFVGLPLLHRAFGEQGVVVATVVVSIHLPIWMTTLTLAMMRAEGGGGGSAIEATLRVIGALRRNPIIIGLGSGILLRFLGFRPSGIPAHTIHTLAGVASPVALVSLGMAMYGQNFRGDAPAALAISAVKLVALPAFVAIACRILAPDPALVGPLVMLAGVPAGINVFLAANQYGVGLRLASSVVTATTALGALTSMLWLIWLAPH